MKKSILSGREIIAVLLDWAVSLSAGNEDQGEDFVVFLLIKFGMSAVAKIEFQSNMNWFYFLSIIGEIQRELSEHYILYIWTF